MTCGIYILRFKGTDKVYIGQSISIEHRYTTHLNNLKTNNGRSNMKLQNAYEKYGEPYLDIACECTASELDVEEQNVFEIFDSIDNGLNVVDRSFEHGKAYLGADNGRAKYPNEVYIEIFKELVVSDAPIKDIATKLGVHVNTVYQISNGSSLRSTLEPMFPDLYPLLLGKKGKRRGVHLHKNVKLINPEGIIVDLTSTLKDFAILYGLNSAHIGAVVNGKAKSHKGWKLLSASSN